MSELKVKSLTMQEMAAQFLQEHCRCGRRLAHFIDEGVWACPLRWERHE